MKSILFSLSMLVAMTVFAQKPKELLYVGTYSQKGEGIYVYEFDRQNLTARELQIFPNKNSPSFLEFHPNKKFCICCKRRKQYNFRIQN